MIGVSAKEKLLSLLSTPQHHYSRATAQTLSLSDFIGDSALIANKGNIADKELDKRNIADKIVNSATAEQRRGSNNPRTSSISSWCVCYSSTALPNRSQKEGEIRAVDVGLLGHNNCTLDLETFFMTTDITGYSTWSMHRCWLKDGPSEALLVHEACRHAAVYEGRAR
jgi:hypothetical protein